MTTRLKLTAGAARPAMETAVIDMTPTWGAIMPALVAALQDGTAQGRDMARAELTRLAAAVDSANARAKGDAPGAVSAAKTSAGACAGILRAMADNAKAAADNAEPGGVAAYESGRAAALYIAARDILNRFGLDGAVDYAAACRMSDSGAAEKADKAARDLANRTADSFRRGMSARVATWAERNESDNGGDDMRAAFNMARAGAFFHVAAELLGDLPEGADLKARADSAYARGIEARARVAESLQERDALAADARRLKSELDDARASYTIRGDSLHTARRERDDARAVLATVRENMAEARTAARHATERATAEAARANRLQAAPFGGPVTVSPAVDSDLAGQPGRVVSVRVAFDDGSRIEADPADLRACRDAMPVAQGPEGAGWDLPTCRACGFPGDDDESACPHCAAADLPAHVFTCDGYTFHRDATGRWGVAHKGDPAPANCAYADPSAVATLKGCDLRNLVWSQPAKD